MPQCFFTYFISFGPFDQTLAFTYNWLTDNWNAVCDLTILRGRWLKKSLHLLEIFKRLHMKSQEVRHNQRQLSKYFF